MKITDRYNRPISYLRIAVNHTCNLNCIYCHHEGDFLYNDGVLSPDQIKEIVEIVSDFGITKVKITGGEPLLRNDIVEIVQKIRSVSRIVDISLVTNGILLEKYALDLKNAGLNRVNVSLASPNRETYMKIVGVENPNYYDSVLQGIKHAKEVGLAPIKMNMVVLKGINDHEIFDMIKLARSLNVILQLIELQEIPIGNPFYRQYHTSFDGIDSYLTENMDHFEYRSMQHRKVFYLKDGAVVELVKPMHNSDFCRYCNKIRITSNGEFKPCLMRYDNHVPFYQVFEKYNDKDKRKEEIKKLFIKAVNRRAPFFR